MAQIVFEKDALAVLDYGRDWSAWLASAQGGAGDGIASPAWVAEPLDSEPDSSPLVVAAGSSAHAGGVTRCLVAGGTEGRRYRLRNTITTAGGLTDVRTCTIRVVER